MLSVSMRDVVDAHTAAADPSLARFEVSDRACLRCLP